MHDFLKFSCVGKTISDPTIFTEKDQETKHLNWFEGIQSSVTSALCGKMGLRSQRDNFKFDLVCKQWQKFVIL